MTEDIPESDRIRTRYAQARPAYVSFDPISSIDARHAFGPGEEGKTRATRNIKDAMTTQQMKSMDENVPLRNLRHIPFWA